MRLSFGPFAFDRRSRLLWREGTEVALPPRVLGVLELLLERPGDVVARQELLGRVWKDAFVTDTSLAEAVSFLRQALGDDSQSPRYIQTVHRRGYRFVAPLTSEDGQLGTSRGLTPESDEPVRPSIFGQILPWTVAVVCAAVAVAALWQLLRQPAPRPAPIARFELRPPSGTWFDRRTPALAVSADGAQVAWSGCESATGICALFVRRIDRLEATRLPGTDGAQAPFFSPDGRWLGFFADGKLKKVSVSGGAAISLADAPFAGGASWGPDGRIVFCGTPAGGLAFAADQGGEVTPLTAPRADRGELRHVWPQWVDDRAIIFTIATSPAPGASGELAILTLPSRSWRTLRTGVARAVPAGHGYLLVSTGSDLQAATFDDTSLTLTGPSDSAMEALATADGIAQFAAGGGTLVALRASPARRRVVWSDAPDAAIDGLARLSQITIAPDGSRAAGVGADGSGSDVWAVDLRTAGSARITFGGVNVSPAWAPDSTRLLFASRTGAHPFEIASSDGAVRLSADAATPSSYFPSSAARDGRVALIATTRDGRTAAFVAARGRAPEPLGVGPYDVTAAVFSPDGRWVALESDESGRREIVVRATDGSRGVPVSRGGGERPSWTADGKWLYFHEGRRLFRVEFDAASGPVGAPAVLFDEPDAAVLAVSPAGRLLIEREPLYLDTIVVAIEWLREIRQKLPAPVATPR